jgi:iron(III) transport system ATP-binding protein
MNPLLRLDGVSKRFGRSQVLEQVDLTLEAGEFSVLIGGSGSGKTTLLRIIAGLERTDVGAVTLRGELVESTAKGLFRPAERRGLGMVFQDYALWPHLSALQNVEAAIPGREEGRQRRAQETLERVGLSALAAKRPHQLSGGEQQRVGIARALAGRPDFILFDEPFSNLDVDVRERLRIEVLALARDHGVTGLLVSHDPVDAWRLADRILLLENGRLTQSATPAAFYARPASARAARFAGAEGGFVATLRRAEGRLGIEVSGGFHAVLAFGVDEGEAAEIYVRPAGVRVSDNGLPAVLLRCTREGGLFRVYWRAADLVAPLCSLEAVPPDREHAFLQLDPDHVFAYPARGRS